MWRALWRPRALHLFPEKRIPADALCMVGDCSPLRGCFLLLYSPYSPPHMFWAITRYAAQASNKGGTIVVRLRPVAPFTTADFTSAAGAAGKIDHNRAMAPVTKGAATLVPPAVYALPSDPRLVTPSPGAISPHFPIELPRFVNLSGLPRRSQAATGITHG